MGTDIATLDNFNDLTHDELMALSGQTKMPGQSIFPMLKINSAAEDDDGNTLPVGAYFFHHPEHGNLYSKDVWFRPFINTYQYSIYDPDTNKYVARSIFFQDWREEIIDSIGTIACGKVKSKDRDQLTEAELEEQKKIKCQRYMYGTVSFVGKTVKGEEIEVNSAPVVWRTGGVNFNTIGDAVRDLTNNNQLLWNYNFVLATKREKKGGNVFYSVALDVDKQNKLPLTPDDIELLKQIRTHIDTENGTIEQEHIKAKKNDAVDAEFEMITRQVVDPDLNDDVSDL